MASTGKASNVVAAAVAAAWSVAEAAVVVFEIGSQRESGRPVGSRILEVKLRRSCFGAATLGAACSATVRKSRD